MMAMVDTATGMVYWVPAPEYQVAAPMQPPFVPVVMPYRLVHNKMAVPVMAPAAAAPVVNTTVFVRGVPREATTQSVETHFQSNGDIVSCHVIRHKDASTNKGIAFVKFRDHAAAQRAIDANSPGVMEQREVFAEWAHPKPAATSAARHLPDQPIPTFIPNATPHHHLCHLAPPGTTHHLINSPSFFPGHPSRGVMPAITSFRTSAAHIPWIVTPGASSSSTMPGGYSPYAPSYHFPSIHVFGFPHPDSFNPHNVIPHQISLPRPPNYALPGVDYNPGSSTSATVVSSDESQSFAAEDSITTLNSERRKGKEHSDDS